VEKIFESFIELFHPFYYGAQTLDFIKERSKNFINSLEGFPQKKEAIEIYLHNKEFYLDLENFYLNSKNFKKYLECLFLFEKLKIIGLIIKRTIKEENLIFWLQDFQKEEIKSNPWIKVVKLNEKSPALDLKFKFLKALKDGSFLISRKKLIEENIKKGGIISYSSLREEIQKFYNDLCLLEERALCLLPFFSKEDERFLPFLILINILLKPLKLSDEEMEELLFSSLFYTQEEEKKWVPIIQSKNFSNAGLLSFLSSCNHPSLLFTIFYFGLKYIEFLFEEKNIPNPSEIINRLYNLPEISDEIKDYAISVLGRIPPSSPALTEDCEPCLVISKSEIAVYQENKFILKEGKAEKPVPLFQFPFNPFYILLNLT